MTDYAEFVKALRICGDSNKSCKDCPVENCPGYGEWEFAAEALMQQSADTIEKLQHIVREYQKFDGFLAAHGMFQSEPMRCEPCQPTQPECGGCEWVNGDLSE